MTAYLHSSIDHAHGRLLETLFTTSRHIEVSAIQGMHSGN